MAEYTITTYYDDPRFEAASSFCYGIAKDIRRATRFTAPRVVGFLAAAPFNFAGELISNVTPVRSHTETIIK